MKLKRLTLLMYTTFNNSFYDLPRGSRWSGLVLREIEI